MMTVSPSSLSNLSLLVCVRYPAETLISHYCDSFMDVDIDEDDDGVQSYENKYYELKTKVFLPSHICEQLFDKIVQQHPEEYMNIFTDIKKCRLTKINLSIHNTKYPVQDQRLISKLFYHPLREINFSGCKILPSTLSALQFCERTLKFLDLSSLTGLKNCFVLSDLKHLVKLNLQGTDIGFHYEHMKYIGKLPNLIWLDLSHTSVDNNSVIELIGLSSTLLWLSLHHCVQITDPMIFSNVILQLRGLVHLDISKIPVADQEDIIDDIGPIVTSEIISELATLPKLISLDISGSLNLKDADLVPFREREKKLKFLGLSKTGLSYHANLPAERVTGESDEEQILTTMEIYSDRPKYISISLRHLFNLACQHNCEQIERCYKLILKAMTTFQSNSRINIAATASLYHLSRENVPANENTQLRRDIIDVLLSSMENLKGILQLQKNACLALCNFKIPMEVEYQYFRVANLLLAALQNHRDDYLRRIAIMLFNTIVCQNAENQKKEIGLHGAISTIMNVIREKINSLEPCSLLETCWSSLWNITDETPENCREFLERGGMSLFIDCLHVFRDSLDLLRNMMGLMGNIAEVKYLRPYLVKEEYIDLFIMLLNSDVKGFEVSYNAAGLLCHILSDGDSVWKLKNISRDQCMDTIVSCIESWDIKSLRNINYRSFKPILNLLSSFEATAAQHWAAWALANLTIVYPQKYCKLVQEENGIQILQDVINSNISTLRTKELAQMVMEQCREQCTMILSNMQ